MSQPKHTQSAGGVVINQTGKVLVVNQDNRSWSLPKGHIDPGEDALTAAKREISEESGVTELKLIKDLGIYQRYKLGKNNEDDRSELKTIFMFLFETGQDILKPTDPHNPEAQWVDKEDVVNLLSHEKDKAFFQKIVTEI